MSGSIVRGIPFIVISEFSSTYGYKGRGKVEQRDDGDNADGDGFETAPLCLFPHGACEVFLASGCLSLQVLNQLLPR